MPTSLFQGGRLKAGTYKIRNIVSRTYVDTKDDVRELCGRPLTTLEDGRGEWEILPLGKGYTIRKAGGSTVAQPDQYCTMLDGVGKGYAVSVSELPVAWKIHTVEDTRYQGFEYVRILWGSTNKVWDLAQWGSEANGTKVQLMEDSKLEPCRIWELVPVRSNNLTRNSTPSFFGAQREASAPPYEENDGGHCSTCSHLITEPSDDGFGTTVTEVTTVTTRTKFRLVD